MALPLFYVLQNLLRRRLRTAVTAGGVALAAASAFCLVGFQRGYQAGLRNELDRLGAHLLVVPKGCPYDAASLALHGASWPCYLKSAYLRTVRATEHVTTAAPVLMSAVYTSQTGPQVVYCGVEPDILQVKHQWRIRGRFPDTATGILVGAEMARSRGWRVGQQVSLPGLAGRSGRIAGVLAPTQGADDLFIYLPLAQAQRAFHRPGQLTHILVRLDDPSREDQVVSQLRGCDAGLEMNVVPLAHLFHTIEALVESTRLLLGCVALVALLAAGAGVSNTVVMAVLERTREIGVLRALGLSRAGVFRLIWLETVVLCVLGGAAGILLALGSAPLVESWLRTRLPFAPHDPLIRPELVVMAACLGGSALLGTASGLVPAWRAARLSPAESIRAVAGA